MVYLSGVSIHAWPSPAGTGLMDVKAFDQAARIAQQYHIIKNKPDEGAYRTDLAQKALDDLNHRGLDIRGLDFKERLVQLTKGRE